MIKTKKIVFNGIKALSNIQKPLTMLVLMLMISLNYQAKAKTFEKCDVEQERLSLIHI